MNEKLVKNLPKQIYILYWLDEIDTIFSLIPWGKKWVVASYFSFGEQSISDRWLNRVISAYLTEVACDKFDGKPQFGWNKNATPIGMIGFRPVSEMKMAMAEGCFYCAVVSLLFYSPFSSVGECAAFYLCALFAVVFACRAFVAFGGGFHFSESRNPSAWKVVSAAFLHISYLSCTAFAVEGLVFLYI